MVGWFVPLHSLKLQDCYSIMPAEEYDCCINLERVPHINQENKMVECVIPPNAVCSLILLGHSGNDLDWLQS